MKEIINERLLVRLLLKKFGPVDVDDVIAATEMPIKGVKKYAILLGGKRASDGEAESLRKEAEQLTHTRLWKLVTETLRYQAQTRMFKDFRGTDEEIYTAGKYLLHAISTLEQTVWACQNPLLLAEQREINSPHKKPMDRERLLDNT